METKNRKDASHHSETEETKPPIIGFWEGTLFPIKI